MYFLDYFVYNVKAFGDSGKNSALLPRKFSLKEILEKVDMDSNSINFVHPKVVHNMENSEKY